MLEIAGGILLAIVILIVVLAFLGPIIIVLSAILSIAFIGALVGGMIWLTGDALFVFILIAIGVAVSVFAYWTHVDTRFHRPFNPGGNGEDNGGRW
jgi:hypothetical protein